MVEALQAVDFLVDGIDLVIVFDQVFLVAGDLESFHLALKCNSFLCQVLQVAFYICGIWCYGSRAFTVFCQVFVEGGYYFCAGQPVCSFLFGLGLQA